MHHRGPKPVHPSPSRWFTRTVHSDEAPPPARHSRSLAHRGRGAAALFLARADVRGSRSLARRLFFCPFSVDEHERKRRDAEQGRDDREQSRFACGKRCEAPGLEGALDAKEAAPHRTRSARPRRRRSPRRGPRRASASRAPGRARSCRRRPQPREPSVRSGARRDTCARLRAVSCGTRQPVRARSRRNCTTSCQAAKPRGSGPARALPDVDPAVDGVAIDLGELVGREVEPLERAEARPRAARRCSRRSRVEVTRGSRSVQASAICASVCPRPSAISFSARIRSSASSLSKSGESESSRLARDPSGMPLEVLVGQHPLRERREGDAPHAELLERVEQPLLDPAVQHRVRRLVDQQRRAELVAGSPPPRRVRSAE